MKLPDSLCEALATANAACARQIKHPSLANASKAREALIALRVAIQSAELDWTVFSWFR
jgi:hypothetical protein